MSRFDISFILKGVRGSIADARQSREYLTAGVHLVWIIDPENEIVIIHRKDASVTNLHKNDELSGEDVLPGFACRVAELFPEAAA